MNLLNEFRSNLTVSGRDPFAAIDKMDKRDHLAGSRWPRLVTPGLSLPTQINPHYLPSPGPPLPLSLFDSWDGSLSHGACEPFSPLNSLYL